MVVQTRRVWFKIHPTLCLYLYIYGGNVIITNLHLNSWICLMGFETVNYEKGSKRVDRSWNLLLIKSISLTLGLFT